MRHNDVVTAESEFRWEIQYFGAFEVRSQSKRASFRSRKSAALIGILGCRPGAAFSRDWLADHLWSESDPVAAKQSLRMSLSDLRKQLGGDAIDADREMISLNPAMFGSQIHLLRESLRQGLGRSDRESILHEALSSIQGPFAADSMCDLLASEWLNLSESIAQATLEYVELCRTSGNFAAAIAIAKCMLGILGCREDLHIGIISLYIDSGTPSLAIQQFEHLEADLEELWGEPPSQAALDALARIPDQPRSKGARMTVDRAELLGRDEDLEQILSLLSQPDAPRLMTLFGSGGIGKTSLARVVADRWVERTASNLVWADISSESSIIGAWHVLASVLDPSVRGLREPRAAAGRLLSTFNGLLVIDNLESIGNHGAEFIAEILEKSSRGSVIVTSRVAVGSPSEKLIAVRPLALPTAKQSLSEIRNSPSMRLFVRQARLVVPEFEIIPANVQAVVGLCRILDGIPLALNLAAARLVSRSPSEILASVIRSIDHLDTPGMEHDRRSSLSRSISSSFEGLTPLAREVAVRVSLHTGAITEQDLRRTPAEDLGEPLEELVRRSIINVTRKANSTEFWMYETVRSYAHSLVDSLIPSPLESFLNFQWEKSWKITKNPEYDETLRIRNHFIAFQGYQDALKWCIPRKIDPEKCAEIIANFERTASFYAITEPLATLIQGFFEDQTASISDPNRARVGHAYLTIKAGSIQSVAGLEIVDRCTKLAGDDSWSKTALLTTRGTLRKTAGRLEEGLEDCLEAAKNCGDQDPMTKGRALFQASMVLNILGRLSESLEHMFLSLAELRKESEPSFLIRVLYYIGSELAIQGFHDQCEPYFDEAIALCQALDSKKMEALTRWQQAEALYAMGKLTEAVASLQDCLLLLHESGFEGGYERTMLLCSSVFARTGRAEKSAKFIGKLKAVMKSFGHEYFGENLKNLSETEAILKKELGLSEFLKSCETGATLDWHEITVLAQD